MSNKNLIRFLFIFCAVSIINASLSTYPTVNLNSLKKVFDTAKPYSDLSNAFYSIRGLDLLGEKVPQASQTETCNFIKTKVDKASLESIYFGLSLASSIPNCQLPVADYQAAITAGASSTNVADLYYYTLIAKLQKLPVDSKKISQSVLAGLKADNSILNQGYSLHIASQLTENQKQFFDSIEDILDQADEVDKKYLQYEGGVGTTSLILEGIFSLSEVVKQFPAKFDAQRLTKFVNYLSSKRFPTNVKSAFFLLRISLKLSDNQFKIPLVLNRLSPISVSSSQPNVIVSLTNIVGAAVRQTQFVVEADSAKSQKTNGAALISAKKPFTSTSSEGTTYQLKLVEQPASADFYTVVVNVIPKSPTEKRFFLVDNKVEVKVTALVNVVDAQVGVADRDQSAPKLTKLEENAQLKEKLDADQQSKFYLRFGIKEKSKGSLVEAHQTFVRFSDVKSGREIVFLAQATSGNQYTAEIDFATNAKNFRHRSGVYSVELLVSDSLIENPVAWKIAEIKLQFIEDQSSAVQTDKASLYAKKPEIKHLFRQPEPTPPAALSNLFTILCLIPAVLLFILWAKIGFNFSRFSFSLSAIAFHLSLAAIFGLFYCYWIKLNMFQTLRYLALLGFVALFSGNSLLKGLAASNKEKKN